MKYWILIVSTLIGASCSTFLSATDKTRVSTDVDLWISVQKEFPDAGTMKLKSQAGYCNMRTLEISAGMPVVDGGLILCPKIP